MPHFLRLAAAALIGTSGTVVMIAMLGRFWFLDWPFVLAACIGAGLSGFAWGDLFGWPGGRGVWLAVTGAGLATATGAALAGLGLGVVAGAPFAGAVMGPVAVGQALVTQLLPFLVWVLSLGFAHLALSWLRRVQLLLPS